MDKANGLGAAATEKDSPTLVTPGAADPTPAGLAALIERLRELGHPRATIANLADKLGVKRPTLIRWIDKDQPFPPEAIEAARAWESNLQVEIERWEAESGNEPAPEAAPDAPPEPQDGPGGASEAKGGQAAGEAPEAPEGAQGAAPRPPPENNTGDDTEAEWQRRRQEYAPAQGSRSDGRDEILRFAAALERLRRATPRPAVFAQAPGLIKAADGLLDFDPAYNKPMILPPRITPRLTRGEVHAIIADPNIGKTTLTFLLAFAIAYERPELLGLLKIDWCGPALIVSNEDDPIDGATRWREPRRYFGLTDPPKHILTVWPDTLALGYVRDDTLLPTEAGCAFVERLAARAERGIRYAYMVFDPLAGMFPGITENAPLQMAAVIQQFFDPIARAAFAAVDVCHHTKKSARDEEKVDSYRGGSGFEGALGEMSTLARLTFKEHLARGFSPDKLGRILRLMGQRKRRGPYAGTHYFMRVVQNVPAVDARQPDQLAAELGSVAFAAPIALPSKPGLTLDNVQDWLWKANQGDDKDRLTRGQRGRGKEGEAVKVVMEKSGCDRKAAEAAIDELEQLKRIVLRKATINGNKVEIVIAEPPLAAAVVDELDAPF